MKSTIQHLRIRDIWVSILGGTQGKEEPPLPDDAGGSEMAVGPGGRPSAVPKLVSSVGTAVAKR